MHDTSRPVETSDSSSISPESMGGIAALSSAEFAAWVALNPPPDTSEPDWHRCRRERAVAALEAARRGGNASALAHALRPLARAAVMDAEAHGSDRKFLVRYMDTVAREFFRIMTSLHATDAAALRGARDAAARFAVIIDSIATAIERFARAATAARLHGLIHPSFTARIAQFGRGAS